MSDLPPRLSGRRLQEMRRRHFNHLPLCVACQAKTPPVVRAATQLDHVVARINGGEDHPRDAFVNRQGLCKECHDAKTDADLGRRPSGAADGGGWPTDPRHPWNVGRKA